MGLAAESLKYQDLPERPMVPLIFYSSAFLSRLIRVLAKCTFGKANLEGFVSSAIW